MSTSQQQDDSRLVGLLAQFDDPGALLHAGEQARVEGGYQKMDAFSPFPVHGIDEAIGIKRTILPFIVLFVGLNALVGAILLQWYANYASFSPVFPGYDFRISGKPLWSLPANIPVVFEIIVLSSAFAAFLGMLILNLLPRLANPLHRIPKFKRVTNDKFFLMIQEKDPNFDLTRTRGELTQWGASDIEEVRMDLSDHKLPPFVKTVLLLLAVLLTIPPVLIYRARGLTSKEPRLHVVPDMDWQFKYEAQELGPERVVGKDPEYFLAEKRAALEQLRGTVAWDEMINDFEFSTGIQLGSTIPNDNAILTSQTFVQEQEQEPAGGAAGEEAAAGEETAEVVEPEWLQEFPQRSGVFEVNTETIDRGRERFNIYCSVCHGYAGAGDGLVNQRALELALTGKASWTAAKSLHDPEVRDQDIGRIFDTITNGRGTMGPYKDQIPVADRWAIVLYVKALQETRRNEAVPADVELDPGTAPADGE